MNIWGIYGGGKGEGGGASVSTHTRARLPSFPLAPLKHDGLFRYAKAYRENYYAGEVSDWWAALAANDQAVWSPVSLLALPRPSVLADRRASSTR